MCLTLRIHKLILWAILVFVNIFIFIFKRKTFLSPEKKKQCWKYKEFEKKILLEGIFVLLDLKILGDSICMWYYYFDGISAEITWDIDLLSRNL